MDAIILLGPPGAGKGTQAARVSGELGLPHISTGEILRQAVEAGTDLGRSARQAMESGGLVSDRIVLGIVEERVVAPDCRRGFILDGFPRNRSQAAALDRVLDRLGATARIVNLAVPREELEARVAGRRRSGGREDDSATTLRRRLEVYETETSPLLGYYGDRVVEISGVGSREEIFSRLLTALPAAAAEAVPA